MSIGEATVAARGVLNLRGLCPICGAVSGRSILSERALKVERYLCPNDGEVAYSCGAVRHVKTPYDLLEEPPTTPLGLPSPPAPGIAVGLLHRLLPLGRVQAGTGLELLT